MLGWHAIIYENIVAKNIVLKSLKMGYKDYKHLVYGNKDSGPLSISVRLSRPGPVSLQFTYDCHA